MLDLFQENFYLYLTGACNTLRLLLCTLFFGLVLSLFFAMIKSMKIPLMGRLIDTYICVIRGTPFLVQLFLIYYGPMQFSFIAHSVFATLLNSSTACAIIALTVNTTAYSTALFTGAIENLPKEGIIAAKSLGLGTVSMYQKIILPQFFMTILPAYTNEIIMIMKCTAVASAITILDVMGVTHQVIANTYQTMPALLIAGLIYSVITLSIVLPCKLLYARYCAKVGV